MWAFTHQQHNNCKWPSCKIQNIWCELSQINNIVLHFLLIQIQNTCRCHIRWKRSLNCIMSSIVTTLPADYLLFIYLYFYAVFVYLWPLYHSDGDILLVLATNPGSFAYFLVHLCFVHRSFVVSPRVISLVFMFVLSHFETLSQPLLMLYLPAIDFIKCF